MTGLFFFKNAVHLFYKYLEYVNVKHIAVVGAKTAQLCKQLGINIDFIPNDYSQEGLLEGLNLEKSSILIPSSARGKTKIATNSR